MAQVVSQLEFVERQLVDVQLDRHRHLKCRQCQDFHHPIQQVQQLGEAFSILIQALLPQLESDAPSLALFQQQAHHPIEDLPDQVHLPLPSLSLLI